MKRIYWLSRETPFIARQRPRGSLQRERRQCLRILRCLRRMYRIIKCHYEPPRKPGKYLLHLNALKVIFAKKNLYYLLLSQLYSSMFVNLHVPITSLLSLAKIQQNSFIYRITFEIIYQEKKYRGHDIVRSGGPGPVRCSKPSSSCPCEERLPKTP